MIHSGVFPAPIQRRGLEWGFNLLPNEELAEENDTKRIRERCMAARRSHVYCERWLEDLDEIDVTAGWSLYQKACMAYNPGVPQRLSMVHGDCLTLTNRCIKSYYCGIEASLGSALAIKLNPKIQRGSLRRQKHAIYCGSLCYDGRQLS